MARTIKRLKSDLDDILIQPQAYHTIPHTEDHLFIPEEFVPLFVEAGWQKNLMSTPHSSLALLGDEKYESDAKPDPSLQSGLPLLLRRPGF